MTKTRKMSSQNSPTLFDYVVEAAALHSETATAGSLDIGKEMKAALSDDVRHARDEQGREISRAQIAARMSDLLGDEITQTVIDNWTAPSHPHRLPVDYLPSWIRATGGRRAAEVISRTSGLLPPTGAPALRAETQSLKEQRKQINKEIRTRESWIAQLEAK